LLKRLGIQVPGAFIEQGRHEMSHAALAVRVERAAAMEADTDGDERNSMILDQPSHDAAWADDFLDIDRASRPGRRPKTYDSDKKECSWPDRAHGFEKSQLSPSGSKIAVTE
jgi:hypothetical protein